MNPVTYRGGSRPCACRSRRHLCFRRSRCRWSACWVVTTAGTGCGAHRVVDQCARYRGGGETDRTSVLAAEHAMRCRRTSVALFGWVAVDGDGAAGAPRPGSGGAGNSVRPASRQGFLTTGYRRVTSRSIHGRLADASQQRCEHADRHPMPRGAGRCPQRRPNYSRTATAPASGQRGKLVGAIPPSGPATTSTGNLRHGAVSTIRSVASSFLGPAPPPAPHSSRTRCTSIGVDNTPSTGMRARRDCRAAERTTARHRRKPLSTRLRPSSPAARRLLCQERVGSGFGSPARLPISFSGFGRRTTTIRCCPGRQQLAPLARGPAASSACSTTQRARRPAHTVTKRPAFAGTDPPHGGT